MKPNPVNKIMTLPPSEDVHDMISTTCESVLESSVAHGGPVLQRNTYSCRWNYAP
jgi:hypothetical protein